MNTRYYLRFTFVDTASEAQHLVNVHNAYATPYIRKNRPAHYTPWESLDGKEKKFVVYYYDHN